MMVVLAGTVRQAAQLPSRSPQPHPKPRCEQPQTLFFVELRRHLVQGWVGLRLVEIFSAEVGSGATKITSLATRQSSATTP